MFDYVSNINSVFVYKGSYTDLSEAEKLLKKGLFRTGDVFTVGSITYCYVDGRFEELGECDLTTNDETDATVEVIEHKCTSCGAPLPRIVSRYQDPVVCEYCGSIYELKWN